MPKVRDVRITNAKPLVTPGDLIDAFPISEAAQQFVSQSRLTIENILSGEDPRVLCIVGPCSVHDPDALLAYAKQFRAGTAHLTDALFPVLRVYFEKPRTVAGWKGLINDPNLNDSFDIDRGLRLARKLLVDVASLELPAATEFLDTTFGQYFSDLVGFGAIGARTVESQVHRELASGLSMPVGFKNTTTGHIEPAIDAIRSASLSHWFPSLTLDGHPAILQSAGNPHAYLILRGGKESGPNYSANHIAEAKQALAKHHLKESIIVDCSHGNSEKQHQKQKAVLQNLGQQIEHGETAVRGIMLESHLVAGNQPADADTLTYGQSITDACLALDETLEILESLASSVRRTHDKGGLQ